MRGKRIGGFTPREKVLEDFFKVWEPKIETEIIDLAESAGRIAGEDMYAKHNLPVYRVSSCDGIAVRAADFAEGMPNYRAWTEGLEFSRADTGDDFDDKYDAVIMIEEVDFEADNTTIKYISEDLNVKAGDNISRAGSKLREGDLLINKGLPVRGDDMVSLAAGGYWEIAVVKKPKVAFMPTGSELIPYNQKPERGQNIDTNSLMLRQILTELGAEPVIYPITVDDPVLLEETLDRALAEADLVIINGGTAKGGEDFNFRLLEKKGQMIHHYVAAAPGRPLALGVCQGKPVINMPGPSMAAYFAADWCLSATVARMLGVPPRIRPTISCRLEEDIDCTPEMAILCRMQISRGEDGTYTARRLANRGHRTGEVFGTNGLYISDLGDGPKRTGEYIDVQLLRSLEFI